MKRLSLISFLICLCANYIFAQFSTYSPNDNAYNVVFDVEDLSSDEIKFYNLLKSHNYSEDNSMYIVNVARAQNNLMLAPATIIEMTYAIDKKNEDNLGSNELFLNIINTTPKTIKEITLKFSFYNGGKQVYDIKTGDPYCILTFRNLKGRVDSEDTNRILSSILDCFHSLKTSDAVNVKKFFNKKANSCKIESVKITAPHQQKQLFLTMVHLNNTTSTTMDLWRHCQNIALMIQIQKQISKTTIQHVTHNYLRGMKSAY